MLLDKNSILSAVDLKRETVPCPEWGGDVIISELSAIDRDRFWPAILTSDGKHDPINVTGKLLVRCIVDSDGNRIFSDTDAEDLGKKAPDIITRLFKVAERINKLTGDDDAVKNSAPGPNESLLLDSV